MKDGEQETHGVRSDWKIGGAEVVATPAVGYVDETTLLAARVDPFGGSQWEVACEFRLGDGTHVPIRIDVDTAAALGQLLIAEAAVSRKSSDDEMNRQMSRLAGLRDGEDAHDIPF